MGLYRKFMSFLTQGKPTARYQKILDSTKPRKTILFGLVKFRRWYLLPLTFLIEMIIGSTTAWTAYCETISDEFDSKTAKNQLPSVINVMVAFLGVANFLTDPAIVRFGPRAVFTVSTTLFFLSNLLIGLAIYTKSMTLIYIGLAVIGGLADGATFPCPLLVLQRYFPDKRGLAAGFATGGYGAGSILGAFGHARLLKWLGKGNTYLGFIILAAVYGVLNICVSPLYSYPPESESEKQLNSAAAAAAAAAADSDTESATDAKRGAEGADAANAPQPQQQQAGTKSSSSSSSSVQGCTRAEIINGAIEQLFPTVEDVLKHRTFYVFSLSFALNSIGFFALLTRLSDFYRSFDVSVALSKDRPTQWASMEVAIGTTGVFNVVGRMLSGAVFDKLGQASNVSPVMYIFSSGMQICGFAFFVTLIETHFFSGLPIGAWIIAFAYGCAFGPTPGMMCQLFGAKHIGSVFAIFFSAWSLVALASGPLLNLLVDLNENSLKKFKLLTYSTLPFMLCSSLLAAYLLYYVRARNLKILKSSSSRNNTHGYAA